MSSPAPILLGFNAPPAPCLPALYDFCGAYRARNPDARTRGAWWAPSPAIARAVSGWRLGRLLTIKACAAGAGVSQSAWSRFEDASPWKILPAYPVWRILTWVMAEGGPAVDLSSE